jgi:maleylacetate reductase
MLTASTAINALAHCVEACYARAVNPLVPPVALEGIRRIVRSLPLCMTNGRNLDAREDLLTGAYLGGFSIGNATMALHHGICHVLGGRTGVAHGVLNAIMLPHVMAFNADAVPDTMDAIARNFPSPLAGEGRVVGAVAATAALVASLPVPQRLRDAGVPEGIIDSIAAEAAKNSTVQNNPKPVTEADLRALLRAAW